MKNCLPTLRLALIAGLGLLMSGRLTAQTFTNLYTFSATNVDSLGYTTNDDGAIPSGGLILNNGVLYGAAETGGNGGFGTVFEINADGSGFESLYSFPPLNFYPGGVNSDGAFPAGLLLSGGTLYGTATSGGTIGVGALFSVDASSPGSGSALYDFAPLYGVTPSGPLIQIGNAVCGTVATGGDVSASSSDGAVFSVDVTTADIADVACFTNRNSQGSTPVSGVIELNNALYGTTLYGGSKGGGTVFTLNPDGSGFRPLHAFNPTTDGSTLYAGLIASPGVLYGVATAGGKSGSGTVFSLTTSGTFKVLHTFSAAGIDSSSGLQTNSDGISPDGALVQLGNTLYGTTVYGGANGFGTIFSVNTNEGFTTLYAFTGGSDGAAPEGQMALSGNTLYGETAAGGTNGNGTLFSYTVDLSPTPEINTASLPDGTNGLAYNQTLMASGGEAPYKWSLASGALPKGMTLSSGGVLAGTPTVGGAFDFTAKVTDSASATATQPLSLTIIDADITPPTLTITTKTDTKTSNDVYSVTGTAKDNVGVGNVWVSVNAGTWTGAAQVNGGWTNWTFSAALTAGTNNLAAYAVDLSGNHSTTNTIKIIYIQTASIIVGTNGDGTIKPDYNGGELALGVTYSMTAKAGKGFKFVNWTDDSTVYSTNAVLKFEMNPGYDFVANFVDATAPTLSVTVPKANAKVTGTTVNVTGKASDNVGVVTVNYQINNGGWQTATGTTAWTVTDMPIVVGANVLQAYAEDAAGNISKTNEVKFTGVAP